MDSVTYIQIACTIIPMVATGFVYLVIRPIQGDVAEIRQDVERIQSEFKAHETADHQMFAEHKQLVIDQIRVLREDMISQQNRAVDDLRASINGVSARIDKLIDVILQGGFIVRPPNKLEL